MRAAHSGQTSPGPQCRAQKPTLQSNLSDKLFPCSFPSASWQDMEVGLPAQGASQHAVSPVFTSRMQEYTTQGWISQAVSMARGRCVSPGWLARAPVITGLHQGVYQTRVPHNSSSAVRASQIQPYPAPSRQLCGAVEGGHRADAHTGVVLPLLPRTVLIVTSAVKRTGPSQAREMV